MTEIKPFVVTIDKNYYPEVDYFDTMEEAIEYADELYTENFDAVGDKEYLITISEVKHYKPVKMSY